jgi:hypothetical protein
VRPPPLRLIAFEDGSNHVGDDECGGPGAPGVDLAVSPLQMKFEFLSVVLVPVPPGTI